MPVKVTDIKIKNEFRTESVDWLLANVGDKITIEIDFEVFTQAISSNETFIRGNNTSGYIGSGWLTDKKGQFKDFKIGDTIQDYNYITNTLIGTHTIIDKQGNNAIQLSPVIGGGNNQDFSQRVFSVTTPITAANYYWNFVENNDAPTFASKIDGTINLLVNSEIDATNLTAFSMQFIGAKPYQIGSATIQGLGTTTAPVFKSRFRIIHRTFITPFILQQQWNNLQSGTAVDYFFNQKCLKGIFKIEAAYEFTDPNYLQMQTITEVQGNTGWFNENFNTGLTNYSIGSVTYTRPDTTVIPSIALTNTITNVEIIINNTTSTPFSNNNTKFALNFSRVPFLKSEYQGNNNNVIGNFFFDRALQTVGSAAINGDNFSTIYKVLRNITGTFISSSQIRINAQIELTPEIIAILSNEDERRYLLWVAVQNHTLQTKDADKVALLVDAELFYEDASDPTMIVQNNVLIRHPHDNPTTEGLSTITVFPEDEVVNYTEFYVDKATRLTDIISLRNYEVKIKAKNSVTGDQFILDSFKLDLSTLPYINGNQYIDFELNRSFHIPTPEIRKKIKVKRRTDLDAADKYYYEVFFPFLARWEYWAALANVNGAFFDIAQPENGFNNFWHRYTTLANWGLYAETIVKATKNGALLTYRDENIFTSNNYDTNPDYEPDNIKAYDNNTNALLYDGVSKNFILGYTDTRIEASFTKISGAPILLDCHMVVGIEAYEEGGIDGRRRFSSKWVADSDTWFKSTDLSNKVVLSVSGNTIKGVCLIDKILIPSNKTRYKITARLYDLTPIIEAKLFQDGDGFVFQDVDNYQFQNQ